VSGSWAAPPDESLDILLKTNQNASALSPMAQKAKPKFKSGPAMNAPQVAILYPPPPPGITKVKPFAVCAPGAAAFDGCILPRPMPGQWEFGAQAFFARVSGRIAWPRYPIWLGWWWSNEIDLVDQLQVPAHAVIPDLSVRYQFRPNWAFRYSALFFQANGGGWINDIGNGQGVAYFGNIPLTWGQQVQTTWQHAYQRVVLVYDALRSCKSSVSVFAGWAHSDDKINVGCASCGWWGNTFSKGGDSITAGLELKQCVKTAANGGTFSYDCKAAAIFIDDVEGWDAEVGGRYSIPLNCGRSGYMKGGYRVVDYKKTQQDFLFRNHLEGGFVEAGFIF
jgi:hypothetical protein